MHGRHLAQRATRVRLLVAASLVLAVLIPGSASAQRSAGASDAALKWDPCGGHAECARLSVPVDYALPDGPSIELALIKFEARQPKARIGSLVVNPGGPGASGVDFAKHAGKLIPDDVRDRFDLVGFDPRGTGRSDPIRCEADLDAFLNLDFSPSTTPEMESFLAGTTRYGESCGEHNPQLAHVSSAETARDLDAIRAALGDDQLNFFGLSYGTYLGALYADMYPENVRAMLLYAADNPDATLEDSIIDQSAAFERNLNSFFDDCAERPSCAFYSDGDPAAAYDELRQELEDEPLSVGKRELTASLFDNGVFSFLYDGESAWPDIAKALNKARRGNGKPLLESADYYNLRNPDGTYDPLFDAYYAIQCVDAPFSGDESQPVAALSQLLARAAEVAPRLGPWNAGTYAPCLTWPVPARRAPLPDGEGAAPILIANAEHDPATPLDGAIELADELESATLVTVGGESHAFNEGLSKCMREITKLYLIKLRIPDDGTTCKR